MEIRKYQQGGYSINPIIYNPNVRATTASGGATQASSSSDKKDNEFIDDALKEIFKTEGLNSDYNALMDYIDKIGLNALNGADPMFSLTKLTTALRYANAVKTNKKEYDSAMEHMYNIHSENDTAVSAKGGVFVLRDNKLTSVNINDLQEGETPLTNAEISSIRSESGAFNNFLTETVKGSTSHAQIKTIVQNAITNLGEYAKDNTYFLNPTSQDSYNRAAKAGLVNALSELNIDIDDLRETNASNLISLQIKDKNNAAQIKSAINNIAVSLSTNQKILLELKARENGIKGGYMDIIALYASQVAKSDYTTDVDLFDTASGTRGKNKTSSPENKEGEITPLMSYYGGVGGNEAIINLTPGHRSGKNGASASFAIQGMQWGQPLDNEHKPIDNSSLREFLAKGFGSITNTSNGIYVGNQKIDPTQYDNIFVQAGQLTRVELPYTTDANGTIAPNWELLDEFQRVKREIEQNPGNAKAILDNSNLKGYITSDGKWDPRMVKPFFAVNVLARGDDHWYGGYSGEINPDTSEGFLVPVEDQGLDEDNVKRLMQKVLGSKDNPYNTSGTIYMGVAFLPLGDSQAAHSMQASGQMPTITARNVTNLSDLSFTDIRRLNHNQQVPHFISPNASKLNN